MYQRFDEYARGIQANSFLLQRRLADTAKTREMLNACNSAVNITAGRIAKCLLPEFVRDQNGAVIATRPPSYAPPP